MNVDDTGVGAALSQRWGADSPDSNLVAFSFSIYPPLKGIMMLATWWSTMEKDPCSFVLACPICAHDKSTHSPPESLLRPLPVPGCPWSHIGINFVTGFSPSQGNTAILIIVDWFSKAAQFVAIPKLPSAKETVHIPGVVNSSCLWTFWSRDSYFVCL